MTNSKGTTNIKQQIICPEHSGCLARIAHLENSNKTQWGHIDTMKEQINKIPVRFNQILIALILLLCGVVANLGYMIFEVGKN